jgi:hypothetical protein
MDPTLEAEFDQLRIEQMKADIANKEADTQYKRGLLLWEPWKVLAAGIGAGAAIMVAATAIATLVLRQLH